MKLQTQIDCLRNSGFKIKVEHYRYVRGGGIPGVNIMPRRVIDEHNTGKLAHIPFFIQPCGGIVEAEITAPDGHTYLGHSECSEKDNFVRKIGTTMAIGRAMQQYRLVQPCH